MHSNPHHPGVALKGFIYWLVLYQFNGRFDKILLGFDTKREKFTELSLPPKASCVTNEYLCCMIRKVAYLKKVITSMALMELQTG